jgi:NADH-quinone oxidoreductase subunit L
MYQAIVFLPLLGCVIAGLFGRALGPRPSEFVTTVLLFISMVLSWIAFVNVGFGHQDVHVPLATWISSGGRCGSMP